MIDWAYIAGVFDCSGIFYISKSKGSKTLQIRIYSSSLRQLKEIKNIIGGGKVSVNHAKSMGGFLYALIIVDKKTVKEFTDGVYPFCIVQKPRAHYIRQEYDFGRSGNRKFDENIFSLLKDE